MKLQQKSTKVEDYSMAPKFGFKEEVLSLIRTNSANCHRPHYVKFSFNKFYDKYKNLVVYTRLCFCMLCFCIDTNQDPENASCPELVCDMRIELTIDGTEILMPIMYIRIFVICKTRLENNVSRFFFLCKTWPGSNFWKRLV